MRTTDDIPEELVACYEWHPASEPPPRIGPNWCLAVSVPGQKDNPRMVAYWDGRQFLNVSGSPLNGVTYWAYLPQTPEDFRAEQSAAKVDPNQADLFVAPK